MAKQRVNKRGDRSGTTPGAGRDDASWRARIEPGRVGWLDLMLVLVPVAILVRYALHLDPIWRFATAGLAIIPLAGQLGRATDHLARRLGPGIGGLLNAAFGNAAELIIALFALFRGLDAVVKASLTGSIIGNLLLVLGASLLAGGLRHRVQHFNRTAAGVGATLMALAAAGLLVPAIFHSLPDVTAADIRIEHELSVAVSILLILSYLLHLVFSLITHKDLFNPKDEDSGDEGEVWSTPRSVLVLVASTAFVAWMSEILVGAVEAASRRLGMTEIFVGVIVVAIVGNAAEHSTAVWMATRNKMDLAVGIALSSALQIALFVAPVLVFASYLRGHPMDLLFSTLEVVAVVLAVMIARMVAEDGESNWLEGAMLLLIYAILGVAFFFLPHHQTGPSVPSPDRLVPSAREAGPDRDGPSFAPE